jgi:hypothetical protein
MKTSELIGPALDWAVSEAEGCSYCDYMEDGVINQRKWSTDWAQGGPLIEREKISLDFYPDGEHPDGGEWLAQMFDTDYSCWVEKFGPTPLIAGMRAYVAGKLGDEVELPEELK